MEKNFKKTARKRIGGKRVESTENNVKFDKKKFAAENRQVVQKESKLVTTHTQKKTNPEVVYDSRYDRICLPKGNAQTHILTKDYHAITVQGRKSLLKKGQLCLLYQNNILQAADGRLARYL